MTRTLIFIFFCHFLAYCSDQSSRVTNSKPVVTPMVRLGSSKYLLQLPNKFKLTEANGKEGQVGYNILPVDTASKMFGFIEIVHGAPVGESRTALWGVIQDTIHSVVLNEQVAWPLYKSKTAFLVAETSAKAVSAWVASNKRNEIDSLIAIVSTLKME